MKRLIARAVERAAAQIEANAALLKLAVPEYLELDRREPKRRLQAARKGSDRG